MGSGKGSPEFWICRVKPGRIMFELDGVPPDIAGLAGALITASFQVGVALGLAILSALATARTHSLLSAHHAVPDALVGGYTRALLASAFFVGAVIPIGLRAANTKGEPPGGTRRPCGA